MENLNHNSQVFPAELKCFIICYGGVLSKNFNFMSRWLRRKGSLLILPFTKKLMNKCGTRVGHFNTSLALEAENFNRIIFGGSNAHSLFCHGGDVGASNWVMLNIHCPAPSERLATKTAYFISSPTFQDLGAVSENLRHLSLLLLVPVSLILVNLNSFV